MATDPFLHQPPFSGLSHLSNKKISYTPPEVTQCLEGPTRPLIREGGGSNYASVITKIRSLNVKYLYRHCHRDGFNLKSCANLYKKQSPFANLCKTQFGYCVYKSMFPYIKRNVNTRAHTINIVHAFTVTSFF